MILLNAIFFYLYIFENNFYKLYMQPVVTEKIKEYLFLLTLNLILTSIESAKLDFFVKMNQNRKCEGN